MTSLMLLPSRRSGKSVTFSLNKGKNADISKNWLFNYFRWGIQLCMFIRPFVRLYVPTRISCTIAPNSIQIGTWNLFQMLIPKTTFSRRLGRILIPQNEPKIQHSEISPIWLKVWCRRCRNGQLSSFGKK